MKVSYLIFAHQNLLQLHRLIQRLNGNSVDFFCHIDIKCKEDYSFLYKYQNVYVFENRYSIDWGGITQVQALLACCKELCLRCNNEDRMVFLLSGYDYPIKNNEYLYEYLSLHRNLNFVAAVPLPSTYCHWSEHGRRRIECYAIRVGSKAIATIEPRCLNLSNLKQLVKVFYYNHKLLFAAFRKFCAKKRIHPIYLKPYGGEFWWILPLKSIQRILSFVDKHPDFLEYHRDTSNPDELFFQTLVYNLFPPESIVCNCLRYVNWKGGVSPQNFTLNDEELLRNLQIKKDGK